jgi:hypothetical protein
MMQSMHVPTKRRVLQSRRAPSASVPCAPQAGKVVDKVVDGAKEIPGKIKNLFKKKDAGQAIDDVPLTDKVVDALKSGWAKTKSGAKAAKEGIKDGLSAAKQGAVVRGRPSNVDRLRSEDPHLATPGCTRARFQAYSRPAPTLRAGDASFPRVARGLVQGRRHSRLVRAAVGPTCPLQQNLKNKVTATELYADLVSLFKVCGCTCVAWLPCQASRWQAVPVAAGLRTLKTPHWPLVQDDQPNFALRKIKGLGKLISRSYDASSK